MSTLKTPDSATVPEPIVSPGRDLRPQEARGSKMAATAQSRGARGDCNGRPGQAKERTMPKKPKPEPKAVERERPYEMISPEPDGEERDVACCAQKRSRGREHGFRMSEEHRTKIQNSRILRVLIDHVEGREEISPARVTAALGLLKKVLPDLQAVTIGGDPANPLRHEHAIDLSSMSDKDLAELVRGGA
jgi:hypothetical protein